MKENELPGFADITTGTLMNAIAMVTEMNPTIAGRQKFATFQFRDAFFPHVCIPNMCAVYFVEALSAHNGKTELPIKNIFTSMTNFKQHPSLFLS